MSAIVELQERIQATAVRLTEYERAARLPGAPPSLMMGIRSLEKLQEELETDFSRLAREEELEVCRYRLLPPSDARPLLDAIANAWSRYQALFSAVYDSIARGESAKKRTSKKAIAETQFGFAFTFSGSIGVALTLPTRQATHSVARELDKAFTVIMEMTKSYDADSLRSLVDRIGVSPLQKFSGWVDAQAEFGAGAGIQWEGPMETASILVQVQEFRLLREVINKVSEPVDEEETVSGMFDGGSHEKRTFRMRLDSGELLKGRFADAISPEQMASFPKRYSARIRRTKTINLVTAEERTEVFLVELLGELEI